MCCADRLNDTNVPSLQSTDSHDHHHGQRQCVRCGHIGYSTRLGMLRDCSAFMPCHIHGECLTPCFLLPSNQQLNMFQDETRRHEINHPPLTTGPTIQFAHLHSTYWSDDSKADRTPPSLNRHRRRASIAAYYLLRHQRECDRDLLSLPEPGLARPSLEDRSSSFSGCALAYRPSPRDIEASI